MKSFDGSCFNCKYVKITIPYEFFKGVLDLSCSMNNEVIAKNIMYSVDVTPTWCPRKNDSNNVVIKFGENYDSF